MRWANNLLLKFIGYCLSMNNNPYMKPTELRVALGNIQDRLDRLQQGLFSEEKDLDSFQIKKTAYFGQAISPVNKENLLENFHSKTEEDEESMIDDS